MGVGGHWGSLGVSKDPGGEITWRGDKMHELDDTSRHHIRTYLHTGLAKNKETRTITNNSHLWMVSIVHDRL
jgi:hypothetical protein